MAASPRPTGDDQPPEAQRSDQEAARLAGMDQGRRPADLDEPPGGGPERRKTIHNEQVKLTATFCNGLALAFAGGGGVTAVLGIRLPGVETQIVLAVVWIVVGFVLHSLGRLILRALR